MTGSTRLPPLQSLRAMEAVWRTRSFTRAGEELGLTQTAVSHQIAQLETWLATRLFVQSRRGVEPTHEGDVAIPAIADALAGLVQAVEAARPVASSQVLHVSTTPEFATQWLQPRLGGFCSVHPEIDVRVTIEYRRARFEAEDVGVAIWLAGALPHSDAHCLTQDYEFVVCSPAVARRLPARYALRAAPLLRYEGARHTVLDWKRWYGQIYGPGQGLSDADGAEKPFDFEAGPCFHTISAMIDACRENAGLALVRTSLVADDLASGRLVQAFTEVTRSDLQYHLVLSPSHKRSSAALAFRAWITAAMQA